MLSQHPNTTFQTLVGCWLFVDFLLFFTLLSTMRFIIVVSFLLVLTNQMMPIEADSNVVYLEKEPLYTVEDIRKAIAQITEDFLKEVAESRGMSFALKPNFLLPNNDDGDEIIQQSRRRRKRSTDNINDVMPAYIRDGIWLLSEITNAETICLTTGLVIDFKLIRFGTFKAHSSDYVLCLVQHTRKVGPTTYELLHGAFGNVDHKVPVDLQNAKRILAFRHLNSGHEELIVIALAEKYQAQVQKVQWFQINSVRQVAHIRYLEGFKNTSLPVHLAAVWPYESAVLFYDPHTYRLNVFRYGPASFDLVDQAIISNDISALCAFSQDHRPYVAIGYRNLHGIQKDLEILRYNLYNHKLSKKQLIQVFDDVIDIRSFVFGSHTKAEHFLAVAHRQSVVFFKYSYLQSQFILFQRWHLPLSDGHIRQIVPYADSERLFVMAIVLESGDLTLLVYNSLRFFSSVIQRSDLMVRVGQQLYIEKVSFSSGIVNIRLMISSSFGVLSYNLIFHHDTRLLEAWKSSLNWCREKRNEVMNLEVGTKRVRHRYSEAYFHSDPLIIQGDIQAPSYQGNIYTENYVQRGGSELFELNGKYFEELKIIESNLTLIDREINAGNQRLMYALAINSPTVQVISGNYTIDNVFVVKYDSNHPSLFHHHHPVQQQPLPTLNVITDRMNDVKVRNLFEDTVRLRSHAGEIVFLQEMHFEKLELPSAILRCLLNNVFKVDDMVTTTGNHIISGEKHFHNVLIVDKRISAQLVNNVAFTRETVLLTQGDQSISNSVHINAKLVHANVLSTNTVNGLQIDELLRNIVRKDEHAQIESPVEFAAGLELYDLHLNGSARFNGYVLTELLADVVWLNRVNQSLWGEYSFESDLHISGHLHVSRINNKAIPEDFILANKLNIIKSPKRFENLVFAKYVRVNTTLNGLQVLDGMPDIMMKHVFQNVTGYKTLHTVQVHNHSYVGERINGLSLAELNMRSHQPASIQNLASLLVNNYAHFAGGLNFERLNGLWKHQFDQLMQNSLGLNQNWDSLQVEQIMFDNLFVNVLDCERVNQLNWEQDLLTLNTSQTIIAPYTLQNATFQAASSIQRVNNFLMSDMDSVLRVYGDQQFNKQSFSSNIRAKSLKVKSINSIPFEEIVFMDDLKMRKITGVKFIKSEHVEFEYLSVQKMQIESINNLKVNSLLQNSLLHTITQSLSNQIQFHTLNVSTGQVFNSHMMNGVSLNHLQHDIVLAYGASTLQNVTAMKHFISPVRFGNIHFTQLFDGITQWEMFNNWMVQNVPQKVDSEFTLEYLKTNKLHLHDNTISGINLELLDRTVVRLDRKTAIHSELNFAGTVHVQGDVLLNGRLNGIDMHNDVVYKDYSSIQTIRGMVRLLGHVHIRNNLEVNGLINGVNVGSMCTTAYRSSKQLPLVVNDDVHIIAPFYFNFINNITYDELRSNTIRHDLQNQTITGRLIIDTLVLDGVVELNRRINDVNIELLFQQYMSKTLNQTIDCEIVLHNDQVFSGDIVVQNNFYVENGIVDGVNLAQIDRHALRLHGDQHYDGNLDFAADVVVQLALNTLSINQVSFDRLMQKRNKVHYFSEETIFSRNLTVLDQINIVNGKQVAGVNIELLRSSAVLRNSPFNYTVRGKKSFDSINVYVLHSQTLNNVAFTKKNLLLRSDKQILTGRISFAGNVKVEQLEARQVNNVDLSKFSNEIVKKNAISVITSPVVFRSLHAKTVLAKALVDNVNISILKTIADTVSNLESLNLFSSHSKRYFNSFDRQQSLASARFLFYEHYLWSDQSNMKLSYLSKPMLAASLGEYFIIFFPATISSNGCHEMTVSLKHHTEPNSHWNKLLLYSVGPVLSVHSNGNLIFLTSIVSTNHSNAARCLSLNPMPTSLQVPRLLNEIVIQIFNVALHTATPNLRYIFTIKRDKPASQIAHLPQDNMLICGQQSCNIFCLPCGPKSPPATINVDAPIRKTHNHKHTLVLLTVNHRVEVFYQSTKNNWNRIQSITLLNVKSALLVENGLPSTGQPNKYLLLSQHITGKGSQSQLLIYATKNINSLFSKFQTIYENDIQSMHVFYSKPNQMEPYVLLRKSSIIVIYRLLGLEGFQPYSQVLVSDRLQWLSVTAPQNYLVLFFGFDCDTQQSDSLFRPHIEILKPRYWQEINIGEESSYNERSEWYNANTTHQENTIVNVTKHV